jgi:pimeloyl-ACP methyl ester carboxylesterase
MINRRHLITLAGASVAASLAACGTTASMTASGGKTFVMVPGAYTGSWLYASMAAKMRAQGHTVHALTFSGLGDKQHMMNDNIDVNTHVADIVNFIRFEELKDVVLVAHSYSGIPATGAVDQLSANVIKQLVYIDALVPLDNMGWSDLHTDAQRKGNMDNLNGRGAGTRLIPATSTQGLPEALGISMADAELLVRKQTPMPGKTYTSRVSIKNGGYSKFDRLYVDCTQPALPTIAQTKQRIRSEPGWKFAELKTGHMPMVSMTDELIKLVTA